MEVEGKGNRRLGGLGCEERRRGGGGWPARKRPRLWVHKQGWELGLGVKARERRGKNEVCLNGQLKRRPRHGHGDAWRAHRRSVAANTVKVQGGTMFDFYHF